MTNHRSGFPCWVRARSVARVLGLRPQPVTVGRLAVNVNLFRASPGMRRPLPRGPSGTGHVLLLSDILAFWSTHVLEPLDRAEVPPNPEPIPSSPCLRAAADNDRALFPLFPPCNTADV